MYTSLYLTTIKTLLLANHYARSSLTGEEKLGIWLAEISSIMAAVPQHSKMVLVLLGSVFFHAECHHQWLVPWYREHGAKTLWLFKVSSANYKPLKVQ